ncbi:MAG: alanyl-tRNA editing protein [Candidatus Hodarchaeales archaeon]
MTKRLYLEDNYLKSFEAKVEKITENSIILDQTAFYPESGGQPGDKGKIFSGALNFDIIDTRQHKGHIIHIVESSDDLSFLNIGSFVKCHIDWDRRYRFMRAHTAQHIISRFFQINYTAETVSTQLKPDTSRLDFHPLNKLTLPDLQEITDDINAILSKNLNVNIFFLPRDEAIDYLEKKDYQTKYLNMVPNSVKEFRIVAIDDYDWAACAGTHVSNTSEVGSIKLERIKNKGKLRERIFYSLEP